MVTCKESGFSVRGSVWPAQQVEIGYRTYEPVRDDESSDECVEVLNGVRLGLYTNSPTYLRGLHVGVANNGSGQVDGLAFGAFNRFGRVRGVVVGAYNETNKNLDGDKSDAGDMDGLMAGVANVSEGDITGVHVGVLINAAIGSMSGFGVSGMLGITEHEMRGFEVGGMLHSLGPLQGNIKGFQIAPFGVVAEGRMEGFQVGGINLGGNGMSGIQIGLANLAGGHSSGLKFGGYNLIFGSFDGALVGGINLGEDIRGLSIAVFASGVETPSGDLIQVSPITRSDNDKTYSAGLFNFTGTCEGVSFGVNNCLFGPEHYDDDMGVCI